MSAHASEVQVRIRNLSAGDVPEVVRIYNDYIATSHATFDLEPATVESRLLWAESFADSGPYRALVAFSGDELVGYATSSRLRAKPAYSTSVETTVYVARGRERQGIGVGLYSELLRQIDAAGVHRAWAAIALPNDPSEALHRRFGFEPAGVFREVGFKFGRYWDVAWYGRARRAE